MKVLQRDLTGANRGNGETTSVLSVFSCLIPGEFKFLARDTVPPYVDNRPTRHAGVGRRRMLVPGKPELREYIPTRRDVVADEEVSQFSDEITVNCAPLV